MQAWDRCHIPEQVFQHCRTGNRGGWNFWLFQKKPDILLQLWRIKAKGDKMQNIFFSEQLVVLSFLGPKCVHLYSVHQYFHSLIFFLCSHREACGPGAAALQCIAPRTRGTHITHLHTPDDAQYLLSRIHDGSPSLIWAKRWEHRLPISGGKVVVALQNESNIVVYSARWMPVKTKSCNQKKLGMNRRTKGGGAQQGRLLGTPEWKWKTTGWRYACLKLKGELHLQSASHHFCPAFQRPASAPPCLFTDVVHTHTHMHMRAANTLSTSWPQRWALKLSQQEPRLNGSLIPAGVTNNPIGGSTCGNVCTWPCARTFRQASFLTFEDRPTHIALYCIT